jgi:hypothetical protein
MDEFEFCAEMTEAAAVLNEAADGLRREVLKLGDPPALVRAARRQNRATARFVELVEELHAMYSAAARG